MSLRFGRVRMVVLGLVVGGSLVMGSACATNARTGSLIGGAVGAAAGQWIGKDTGGTLIGAGVGAAAGYMIGNEADKEEAKQPNTRDDRP